jgi:hypothetical protein
VRPPGKSNPDGSGTVTYSVYKDGQPFTVPQGQTTYTMDWLSPGRTYSFYVNGVLSPLPVGAGIDRDFVYGTASGENTFTVKAVDRAGNTSEVSNAVTDVC